MTQPFVPLSVALVAGAAAVVAPRSPARATATAPNQALAPSTQGTVARSPADQALWLARFGTYDVRQGTWNLAPSQPRGC